MTQMNHPNKYMQGYSHSTIATHRARTADSDAAFLLPYIKKADRILDVGCGPGTMTTSLAKYASSGSITGIDISLPIILEAQQLADDTSISTDGPASVKFEQADVTESLPFPDDHFDIIFASQVFGHFVSQDRVLRALLDIKRVLKPGGIVATRDGAAQHFYPQSLDLDQLWVRNSTRDIQQGSQSSSDLVGTTMPRIFHLAGFDSDGGKVRIGGGATVYQGADARQWLAARDLGQMKEGDAFRQTWLDARITEEEIEEAVAAVKQWAATDNAWYGCLQFEMLAWK